MPSQSDALPKLFNVKATAKYLDVSEKTVRRWIDAGDLPTHRVGRQIRVSEPDLAAFVRQRRSS